MKEGDKLCIRGLIMRGIVEGDQVDHTVLGTVGPCILKVSVFEFASDKGFDKSAHFNPQTCLSFPC